MLYSATKENIPFGKILGSTTLTSLPFQSNPLSCLTVLDPEGAAKFVGTAVASEDFMRCAGQPVVTKPKVKPLG